MKGQAASLPIRCWLAGVDCSGRQLAPVYHYPVHQTARFEPFGSLLSPFDWEFI